MAVPFSTATIAGCRTGMEHPQANVPLDRAADAPNVGKGSEAVFVLPPGGPSLTSLTADAADV
jgi:hypothetical protein